MIQNFGNELLRQLEDGIRRVAAEAVHPFHRLKMLSKLLRKALEKLRAVIEEANKLTYSEEIHFFKNIKPEFYEWRIFHSELFSSNQISQRVYGGYNRFFFRLNFVWLNALSSVTSFNTNTLK